MMALPPSLLVALLRLSGRPRRFRSGQALREAIAAERLTLDGLPPADVLNGRRVEHRQWAGRRCLLLAPTQADAAQMASAAQVLYLHGGAYCAEMSAYHWRLLAQLVDASGCTVHVPLYPLAPEHDHRPAWVMLEAGYRDLSSQIPPERLVLMGDSSGGGLALALAQWARDAGLPQPRDIILLSPWLDLRMEYLQRSDHHLDDPWLALPGMQAAAGWWAGGDDLALPHLSPLNGSLAGLGRISLFIGTRDSLIAECRELRRRAAAQAVALDWFEAPGMIHVWPLLPVRGAAAAREQMARVLRPGP